MKLQLPTRINIKKTLMIFNIYTNFGNRKLKDPGTILRGYKIRKAFVINNLIAFGFDSHI